MIAYIPDSGGKQPRKKKSKSLGSMSDSFVTLAQLRQIDQAFKPVRAKDGADFLDRVSRIYEGVEFAHYPGLEPALIGLVHRGNSADPVLCYSRERIVKLLMVRDGMDHEEAEEFVGFNIDNMFMGERTPFLLS